MDFKYIVRAEIEAWSETVNVDELMEMDKSFVEEFTNPNPFIAREQAFLRLKSFEESFWEAERLEVDYFLKSKDDVHKEFKTYVFLLNSETGEEYKIHKNEPSDEELAKWEFIKNDSYLRGFDGVLPQLEKEFDYLLKNNIDVISKKLQVTLIDETNDEVMEKFTIIPTEYINQKEIKLLPMDKWLKVD